MKKNNKKGVLITIVVLVILAIVTILYFTFNFKNKNSLNLDENKWINSNKFNVIDVAVLNDIPALSYEGTGVLYEFLDYVTDKTSLNFNVISYKVSNTNDYNYKMDLVTLPDDNDIVLLKDDFVLVTKNNKVFKSLDEISNLKLGVLSQDIEVVSDYFKEKNVELVEYSDSDKLKAFRDEKGSTSGVDGILILKSLFTKELVEDDSNISFEFTDLNEYFVLTTSGAKELNSILHKSYNSWQEDNFSKAYYESLMNFYFKEKNISDGEQKKLKSKSYVYGFINYGIYSNLKGNKISGLSGLVLKNFNEVTGLSITYTRYNSISKLMEDFNSNKVDFVLDIVADDNYKNEVYKTYGAFDKNVVVISGIQNSDVIENITSLKNKEVLTVKDTYLENYLIENDVKVKSYNNLADLAKDFGLNDIAIVDLDNYTYYKTSSFKDSKINCILNIDDKYSYVINSTEDNNTFKELFDFYIKFSSIKTLISDNYSSIAYENVNITYILVIVIIILLIYVVVDFYNHIKVMISRVRKNKRVHLSKEDKIKYIDQLTSLKNRAYLNSRIESWDDSEVYPQAIIVIDLNNISYINDNYGREEGDKVITEAANILMQHQLHNSEIIRTDGNEFLLYLVGYTEKQVISYLRKLNKEFKNLSHGFGAASGYSIITDAIKTFDDAVNEATIEMKNNKEDIDY